jgi:hypothetical protein
LRRCAQPKLAIAIANAIARKQRKKRKQKEEDEDNESGRAKRRSWRVGLRYHNVEAEDSGGRGAVDAQPQRL